MKWLKIRNLQAVPLARIPLFSMAELRENIIFQMESGKRLVQFFGVPAANTVTVYVLLADDLHSQLYLAGANMNGQKSFTSITPQVPSFHLFERELFEQFGITPEGHPWLKPVRSGIAGIDPNESPYPFFHMAGEEVHEVGVGPIHAGVIEPGHFRFSCTGEMVHHLEIELGFQHRGLERLFIKNRKILYLQKLAESIAGDTVIGHAGAFSAAMEALSGTKIPRRAELIRTIAQELERIGVHLGDLSALAGDVADATGNAVFGALRTEIINTSMAICGSRFGRGLLTPGGVNYDISTELRKKIIVTLNAVEEKATLAADVLFASSSVLSRFEKTGIVTEETARQIGMVGPAARASGIRLDIRADFPYSAYTYFPVHTFALNTGDVFARAYIRFIEIRQSLSIIREQLANLSGGAISTPLGNIKPEHLVVSLSEGWRGEIAHIAITDKKGQLGRYKIKDPSFHNWLALALSLRNEGISDFPICNKSFNLSYCGFDL